MAATKGPQPGWCTPQQAESLATMLAQATNYAANERLIKTQEGRLFIILHLRLIETLLHGEPKTPLPTTHHV